MSGCGQRRWSRAIAGGLALLAAAVPGVLVGPVGSATAGEHAAATSFSPAGSVFGFGVPALGSLAGIALSAPPVGIAATPSGHGYWIVATDGGVFAFGDARFRGSMGGTRLSAPVVGIAATPSGRGYWLVAADGGVFAFGDARFRGSMGGTRLVAPVVGMAATPSGRGYWLVAADGGVFAFGDARFRGSGGGGALASPVVGIAATASGAGYWLAESGGAVLAFGVAPSYGGVQSADPVVGITAAPVRGYWLVAADGGVFSLGGARFHGSAAGAHVADPVVGLAAGAGGYWVAEGTVQPSPFGPAVLASLDAIPGLVTAAVEDLQTGNVFTYRPGLALETASTVKVEILGTLLSEAQAAGRALTPGEQSLAAAMIEVSDNNAATELFDEVGGAPAVQAWDRSIGLTGTTVVGPAWYFTTTTATDQLRVLSTYLFPNPVLDDASRGFGLALLARVEAIQIFGVNYGIDPAALRAVKTGRLPDEGVYNAIGWVDGDGRDYLIAAYTQAVPSEGLGDLAMDTVSAGAWATLRP